MHVCLVLCSKVFEDAEREFKEKGEASGLREYMDQLKLYIAR